MDRGAALKVGPHFYAPPPRVVADLARRLPQFWPAFKDGVDRALSGRDVTVVNWFRDAALNARVGGAPQSQHRWGTALDLVGPGAEEAASVLALDGWHVIHEGDHVHVQAFPAGLLETTGIRPG